MSDNGNQNTQDRAIRKKSRYFILPIIILLIAAAPFILRRVLLTPQVADSIKTIISEKTTAALSEPLELGELHVDIFGRVVINEASLGSGDTAIFKADRLVAGISLPALLKRSTNPGRLVNYVRVENPVVRVVRLENGDWNYLFLFKNTSGAADAGLPEFPVHIKGARVVFEDRFAENPYPITYYELNGVSGTLQLLEEKVILLETEAEQGTQGHDVKASLRYDMRAGWRVEATIEDVPLGYATGIIGQRPFTAEGNLGKVQIFAESAFTSIGHAPNFSWGAYSSITGAALDFNDYGFSLSDVSADFEFVNSSLIIDKGSAKLGGGSIEFSGAVHTGASPAMAVEGQFENLSLADIAPIVSMKPGDFPSGIISGDVLLTGAPGAPDILASIEGRGLKYQGYRADSVYARAVYSGGRISMDHAELRRGAALATLSGIVDLTEEKQLREYRFTADVHGMELPEIIAAAGGDTSEHELHGAVSGRLFVSGGPENDISVFGTLESGGLSVTGLEAAETICSFSYDNELLTIENLVVDNGEETLVARGTVARDGTLDIDVAGARSRMGGLVAFLGRDDLQSTGTVTFDGHITGALDAPEVEGAFEGRDIQLSTFRADRITGGLALNGSVLDLRDISIYTALDRHELAGTLNFNDRTMILYIIMQDTSLQELAGLARDMFYLDIGYPEDLGGTINARGLVMGTFDNPVISLNVTASDITAYGEKIDRVEALVDYIDYPKVNRGKIFFAGASIDVSGSLDPENMSLEFKGEGLMLERINHIADVHASGSVAFSGTAFGPMESPYVQATLRPGDMLYRNVDFTADPINIVYDTGQFTAESINISRGDEKYTSRFKYDMAASSYDIRVTLENAALKTFIEFLPYEIPDGTSGTLDGECRVFVSLGDYSGKLNLSGQDLTIGTYPLTELTLEGNFQERIFNITSFESRNDVSQVEMSGILDLDQKIASKMNISAYGIELARFSEMGLIPGSLAGMADIDIEVLGENGTQKTVGSITAHNPAMYGLEFDLARSRFEFDGNILSLNELQFLDGPRRITLAADIPLREGYEDKFSIRPASPELDLSALNTMLKDFGIELEGEVRLDGVSVAGTIKNPVMYGSISLENAVFKHADIGTPVTGISGRVHLEGNSLVVDSLEGRMSDSPVGIKGHMEFTGMVPDDFDFSVADANSVYLEYKDIYKGRADVRNFSIRKTGNEVEVYSPSEAPAVLTLHDASVSPPQTSVPEAGETHEALRPPLPISFGQRPFVINVTEGVLIKSGRNSLRLEPTGTLQLSGSTAAPSITGWLTSSRGHLRYLGNTFKMQDTTYIGFYSLEGVGVVPIFYMLAAARVSGTDITMEISGPMVDVNLYAAYRELCSGTDMLDAGSGLNVPKMPMGPGGEITVPVCPIAEFTAYEDNISGGQPLSTQQIMQKLTHTEGLIADTDRETGDVLRAEAFSIFTPYVGSVVEKGIDLENFSINLDPNKDVLVQLEKRVAEKLYIKYERLFSRATEETIEARYKFRKRSFLKWGIDQDNNTDYQVEYQLRF